VLAQTLNYVGNYFGPDDGIAQFGLIGTAIGYGLVIAGGVFDSISIRRPTVRPSKGVE
jgi:hypothetical protein